MQFGQALLYFSANLCALRASVKAVLLSEERNFQETKDAPIRRQSDDAL
jgi:hypothetical protein